jgi:hypothetical protein
MFKFIFPATALATLLLSGVMIAQAAPGASPYALSCGGTVPAASNQSCSLLARRAPGGLLQIRDVQSARNGGGNGCWNACFTDFDECMGMRTKDLCVSRVKTCLETCDRLSNRPGM